MMNSYRRNEGRGKLIAATALVVFLFLVDIVTGGKVRAAARLAGGALFHVGSAITTSIGGSGFFSSRASLEAQVNALDTELAQAQEQSAELDAVNAENAQLRQLVNLAQAKTGVTAVVISSLITSPYGTFQIDAGQAEGIAQGNLVLTPGGFVAGVVSSTASHSATVAETFAPGATVEAIVEATPIALSGSGGGNAHGTLPRAAEVKVGDTLVAPQFAQRPVGIVGAIASSSASATQDIYARLPQNLGALQYVYVIPAW